MKELSIEEKAKRYDEAIEKLRRLHDDYDTVSTLIDVKKELENIFPELAESEDERIRKELKHYLEVRRCQTNDDEEYIGCNHFLAWLEKQGEHANFLNKIQIGDKVTRNEDGVLVNLSQLKRVAKPAEVQGEQKPAWSEEDEKILKETIVKVEYALAGQGLDNFIDRHPVILWLKFLKDRVQPKQEWREEDRLHYMNVLEALEYVKGCKSDYDKIEAVKSDIAWFKSLKERYTWKPNDEQMAQLKRYCPDNRPLTSLYEQLKKLRGE